MGEVAWQPRGPSASGQVMVTQDYCGARASQAEARKPLKRFLIHVTQQLGHARLLAVLVF